MKENKKHISRKDFQRYLENQMTDAERNAFERELQKGQFEAEALEGFQQISPADLEKDLNELSTKINSTKKKNNTRIWAAAATFLLLISAGLIWFQLKEKSPVQKLAVTKTFNKTEAEAQKIQPQKSKDTIQQDKNIPPYEMAEELNDKISVKKQAAANPASYNEKLNKEEVPKTVEMELKPVQIAEVKNNDKVLSSETKITVTDDTQLRTRGISSSDITEKSAKPMAYQAKNNTDAAKGSLKSVKGKVVSSDDNLPLPGVTIVEKGTTNGTVSDMEGNFSLQLTNKSDSILVASFVGMEEKEFSPSGDSGIFIEMEPSQLALDEVVAIGYGVSNTTQTTESIKNARPKNGMDDFRKYMDKNAILPQNYEVKRVVVKALLQIDSQGNIISVTNDNQAENSVFETAKQILLNGPDWNPKTINGTPVESEITIRIVFKKE